ncbi:MAG: hypothetical protein ACXWCO_00735 [Caldimonas sp.]
MRTFLAASINGTQQPDITIGVDPQLDVRETNQIAIQAWCSESTAGVFVLGVSTLGGPSPMGGAI